MPATKYNVKDIVLYFGGKVITGFSDAAMVEYIPAEREEEHAKDILYAEIRERLFVHKELLNDGNKHEVNVTTDGPGIEITLDGVKI